ncbi:hypothetical protein [Methylorubrum zatmanii]
MLDDPSDGGGVPVAPDAGPAANDASLTPESQALQKRIAKTIREDKRHFKPAFDRMKRDMRVAMHGADKDWGEGSYRANITGRHVKAKTAALYAKNPKAVARRIEKLDFQVWDESMQSLQLAFQTIQQGAQVAAAGSGGDPLTGEIVAPQLPPGFEQAQAVMADFQQGMATRQQAQKIAKTLEILFAHSLREQQPLPFKDSMKQCVRRACTTGVGYVKLAYQRETGPSPSVEYRLLDSRERLAHLQGLLTNEADETLDAEIAEVEQMIAAIEAEPEIVVSEGLVFDFPQSTKVIPDKLTRSLVGFVGARHLTVEYLYTPDEVKERFGVDLKRGYKAYTPDGKGDEYAGSEAQGDLFSDEDGKQQAAGLACVWEYFDKASGLVYYLCDGYEGWLREPGPPDVYVDGFWPVWALTFNETESEDELFPPSDVSLILDIQREYNRSRDGKREHRRAARPRWVYPKGALEDEALVWLSGANAFTATGIKMDPARKIGEVLQPVPVPGVDPNLYDVNEIMADLQFVVGSSQSMLGAPAKGTATANQIAAGASATTDGSSVDDLDSFLTALARGAGQILLREMSEETVVRVVGPGAVWPELSLQEIADELFLEVEAGSTGKPNQAVELANWEKMLPFLLQMQGIEGDWLARETLRRLDDRMDLTEALASGIPSIVAQNRMAQVQPGDPNAQPTAQGHTGGQQVGPSAPGGAAGRGAPMGAEGKPAAV